MKDWWLYEWMYEGVEVLKARRNYVEQQDEAGGDSLVPVWKVHCRCQLLDQKPSKHPLIQYRHHGNQWCHTISYVAFGKVKR